MSTGAKFVVGLSIVAVVGVGGWFAWRSQSGNDLADLAANAGAKLTDDQVARVVAHLQKFIAIPEGEKPSAVVLNDTEERARQQAFFRDAKDGDILVYFATRAMIYDPVADKLVNYGPVISASPSATPDATASQSEQLATPIPPEDSKVEVRNGTTTVGLAGTTAKNLAKKYAWVTDDQTWPKAADAAKNSYTGTTLVDLSKGAKPGALAALESEFGVKAVSALPQGEASSTADFVVILGK